MVTPHPTHVPTERATTLRKGGLSGVQLQRALEYVDGRLDSKITAEAVANIVGLSKYHFGKAFKQEVGLTLRRYVMTRRIARSQELLRTSNLPLATIAATVGFSNQSHFTAVFSLQIGIAPGFYTALGKPVAVSSDTDVSSRNLVQQSRNG